MSQVQKIIDMCKKEEWICQTSFWPISKSPHKRRDDIIKQGKYTFEDRKCEHGHKGVKDYKMIVNGANYKKVAYTVPLLGKTIIKLERI